MQKRSHLYEGNGVWRPVTVAETEHGHKILTTIPTANMPEADFIVAPGFTDWHVHSNLVTLENLKNSPVTRVLDLGSNTEDVQNTRENLTPEIDFLYAGAMLTAPGGYPSDRDWAHKRSFREIAGPEAFRVTLSEMKKLQAAAIKIAQNSTAGPVYTLEELQGHIKDAQNLGLPVIVHAEGPGEAMKARRAGASHLAHTPFTETLTNKEIKLQAETVTWISTIDIHGWGANTPEREIALENLHRFVASGGRVLYGTDMGNGPTESPLGVREILALKAAGLYGAALLDALTGELQVAGGSAPKNKNRNLVVIPGDPSEFDPLQATLLN